MQVRCPHCHTLVELSGDSELSDIPCPSCGSNFSLLGGDETTPYESGTKTIGHFELIEQIGAGSFGFVWRARDTELDRTVAVKMPRKGQLDPEETEQFLREARSAAQLRHPNIVSVHEVGREDDSVFIVSDFIEGVTLADRLTAQSFSVQEAAKLCAKIADALHHAHEQRVIHRDLKPGNIILDADGEPHIMDFGLARRELGEVTMTVEGRVLGTPAYMSPEQAKGDAHTADRRSDVYSAGVILFELLTGERPFRGNARMLVHQVIHEEAPSPKRLNGSVPRDLETICLKCLQKESTNRYSTSQSLADDLRRYLDGKPIEARPITRIEQGWRWCKRKPALATLLCLLVLVTVIAPVVAIRESALRGEADRLAINERNLRESAQQQAQQLTLEKAWGLPEQGRIAEGMLWMVRCLEVIPADQRVLHQAIRANLAAWHTQLHPLHAVITLPPSNGAVLYDDGGPQANFIQNGSRIVITSPDGEIRVFSATTLRQIGHTLQHSGGITALAVSPDGGRFLTCGVDKTARLWDSKTLQPYGLVLEHNEAVTCGCFSPDGTKIVTGSEDARARLWDASTQKTIGALQHDSGVSAVAFENDGSRFVTCDQEGFHLWDAENCERLGKVTPYNARVFSVHFSPKEPRFLSGSQDQTVQIRDAMSGHPVGAAFRHPEPIHAVAFGNDGQEILTGCRDGIARRWDVRSGRLLGSPMHHRRSIMSAAYSPDKSQIITASLDRTVRLWNIPVPRRHGPLVHRGMVRGVAFSPDGIHAVTASSDGAIQEWNVATTRAFGDPILVSPKYAYTAVYSPDKTEIAIGYSDGVRQWNRSSRKWTHPVLTPSKSIVDVTYSPDGSWILAAGSRSAKVWSAADGALVWSLGNFHAAAFNHDGSRIVASQYFVNAVTDPQVCVWNSQTGTEILRMDHESSPWAVAFHPDGTRFLTGTVDGVLRIWNTKTGEPRSPRLRHHESSIRRAAFSPDGTWIVTGSHDRTARISDVATGRTIGPPMEHSGPVKAVAINPDGTQILTGDGDGNGWIWDTPPPAMTCKVERIALWVQVITGMELKDGQVQLLDSSEWTDRRQRLDELGGPPTIRHISVREPNPPTVARPSDSVTGADVVQIGSRRVF